MLELGGVVTGPAGGVEVVVLDVVVEVVVLVVVVVVVLGVVVTLCWVGDGGELCFGLEPAVPELAVLRLVFFGLTLRACRRCECA